MAEFVVNNQVHIVTKILLFMEEYKQELRMGADIRRKIREDIWICRKNEENV